MAPLLSLSSPLLRPAQHLQPQQQATAREGRRCTQVCPRPAAVTRARAALVATRNGAAGTRSTGSVRCRSFFEDVKPEPATSAPSSEESTPPPPSPPPSQPQEQQREAVASAEGSAKAPLTETELAAEAARNATALPEHIKPEDMAKFYSILNQPNWDGVQQRVGELVQQQALDERVLEAALIVLNEAFERKEEETVLNSLQNLIEYLTIIIKRMKQPPELQLMEALMEMDHTDEEQQQQIKDTFVMAFAEDGLCTKEDFLAQMAQWEQQAAEQDKVFDQKRQEAVEQGSKAVVAALDKQLQLREQAMERIGYIKQAAAESEQ